MAVANSKIKQWGLFLGLLLQVAVVSSAYGAAGRFQFVVGDVQVVDAAGKARAAVKGAEVNEGESIVSGASGSAQLVMVDNAILAVRPDTRMKIDEYKYNGKEDGSERSFLSIVKGGFRSITGAIGKTHRENYGIKTPAATIGIRGTDSETVHVVVPLPAVPAGTYNKVNQGATVMNGTPIAPNQVGYTPNLQTAAVILPAMPPIFEPPKPTQGPKEQQKGGEKKEQQKASEGNGAKKNGDTASTQNGQTASGTTSSSSTPSSTATATSTVTNTVTTVPPATVPIVTGGTVTGGGVVPATQFINAPFGSGGVGSEIAWRSECVPTGLGGCTPITGWFAGAGAMVREAGKTQTLLLDPGTGMPVLIAEQSATDNFQYTAGTASVQGYGQAVLAGGEKVAWGRYAGGTLVNANDGTVTPLVMNLAWTDMALSYAQAQNIAFPRTFSTYVGGSVTDELGNVYSSISGTLTLTSLNNVKLDIATSVPGRVWNLHYGVVIDALNNIHEGLSHFYGSGCSSSNSCGLGLNLATSTYNGGTLAKGEAHGVLVGSGTTVNGALTSFSANSAGSAALSGVVVLK